MRHASGHPWGLPKFFRLPGGELSRECMARSQTCSTYCDSNLKPNPWLRLLGRSTMMPCFRLLAIAPYLEWQWPVPESSVAARLGGVASRLVNPSRGLDRPAHFLGR